MTSSQGHKQKREHALRVCLGLAGTHPPAGCSHDAAVSTGPGRQSAWLLSQPVKCHAWHEAAPRAVQVFEFMESDLEALIKDRALILSEADVKSYLQMLLRGLEVCHAHWVLHRDVKPNNFLIASTGARLTRLQTAAHTGVNARPRSLPRGMLTAR